MIFSLNSGQTLTRAIQARGRTRAVLSHLHYQVQSLRLRKLIDGRLKFPAPGKDAPIISLTSWTPRKEALPISLLTLLDQVKRPGKIFVWLASDDASMLPTATRDAFVREGVEFLATEDYGPHKKWWPMIEHKVANEFVTADDDIFYPRTWLSSLISENNDTTLVCHRAHQIRLTASGVPSPYSDWQHNVVTCGVPSHQLFPTSGAGTIMHRRFVPKDFVDPDLFMACSPRADDIWLKLAYVSSNTPCMKSRYFFPCLEVPGSSDDGLFIENVDGHYNDVQLAASMKALEMPAEILRSLAP